MSIAGNYLVGVIEFEQLPEEAAGAPEAAPRGVGGPVGFPWAASAASAAGSLRRGRANWVLTSIDTPEGFAQHEVAEADLERLAADLTLELKRARRRLIYRRGTRLPIA